MPDIWRQSTLVPIFKEKGDVQSCENYRGIKLMSHTLKLFERVIDKRLRGGPIRTSATGIYERSRDDRFDIYSPTNVGEMQGKTINPAHAFYRFREGVR